MKTIYFFICFLFINANLIAQLPLFQNNIREDGKHFLDLNTLELDDGTNDFMVAGTMFDSSFSTKKLTLMRIDDVDGSVVWDKYYDNVNASRGFDITRFNDNGQEFIAVTGYVDSGAGSLKHIYIGIINASTGAFAYGKRFAIGNDNSQGLHITYTERDFNGNQEKGFVVGGFLNSDYDTNIANSHEGFVMRVDLGLHPLWTRIINTTGNNNKDYDMVNNITETDDGYFITGSITQKNNGAQQGVLAMRLNNEGIIQWKNTFIIGNSRDVGVDSFYNAATDEIFLLTNYSVNHHFGMVVFNENTGVINTTKSWEAASSILDRYGFKLEQSQTNSNNLIVFGYEKEKYFLDPFGTPIVGETVPFVFEFEKNTGLPTGISYNYLVPFKNNINNTDYFRFWDWQMPLIFYPDITVKSQVAPHFFMVGYRSFTTATTAIEQLKIGSDLLSECFFEETEFNTYTSNFINQGIAEDVGNPTSYNLVFIAMDISEIVDLCESGSLGLIDSKIQKLKIYPNPSNGIVYLENNSNNKIDSVIVYSINGSKVFELVQNNIQSINLNHLTAGLYFIKTTSNDNTFINKLIKN